VRITGRAAATIQKTRVDSRSESKSQSRSEELIQECGHGGRLQTGSVSGVYAARLAKGIRPEMARLTLARKIAAITLTVWKKGARFDANI
jgi:hypothetical protein